MQNDGLKEEVLYETMLGKLGSRIVLIPQANKQQIMHGLLGFYYDEPVQVTLAAFYQGKVRSLPFSSKYRLNPLYRDNQGFESITQEIGMTYIAYNCHSEELPYNVRFTITAPFYPKDIKLSTAPFFYIEVGVTNLKEKPIEGSILVALEGIFGGRDRKGRGELYQRDNLLGCVFKSASVTDEIEILAAAPDGITYSIGDYHRRVYNDFASKGILNNHIFTLSTQSFSCGALCWKFRLGSKEVKNKVFILAGYFPQDALNIEGKGNKFLYTTYFKDAGEILSYAKGEYRQIQRKLEFFEDSLGASSLPDYLKKLIAFSFQSYIANTWWVSNGKRDWFSVWEGCCRFHSTIDVGYNAEIFSLMYWPELLKLQLEEWSTYPIKDYLAHDMGDDLKVFGQSYDHDMPVEESTNYLLLLYAYWKFTGDKNFVIEKYGLVKRLLGYLMRTDTDNDGLPDIQEAVLNTIDDGSGAIQGSKGQTYLGVKCLTSFVAGRHFAICKNDRKLVKELDRYITRLSETLVKKCWREDHFAICLDKNVTYRDGYSIYASNGLLYLLLTDTDMPIPLELFRQDIELHIKKLMKKYGCPHSDADYTMWVSQNMWRDIIGMYLGINTLENTRRYWDFELTRNSWDTGSFTDVYRYGHHQVALDRYPRGIASLGYIYALGGIAIDKESKNMKIVPQRTSLKVPLVSEAVWDKMKIPWVNLIEGIKHAKFEISEFTILNKFREMELKIPTSGEPESIQLYSLKSISTEDAIGRTIQAEGKKVNILINSIQRNEKKGIWITEVRLSLKEGYKEKSFSITIKLK